MHQNVLVKDSEYFKRALEGPWVEGQERVFSFTFDDFTAADMGRFVSLLYMDSLAPKSLAEALRDHECMELVCIWRMADYLQTPAIKARTLEALKARVAWWAGLFTSKRSWRADKKSDRLEEVQRCCDLVRQLEPDIDELAVLRKEFVEACSKNICRDALEAFFDEEPALARELALEIVPRRK